MKQHKHAEVLRAIANGKEVQYHLPYYIVWIDLKEGDVNNPIFQSDWEWRIKPEVKPDFVMKFQAISYGDRVLLGRNEWEVNNLKLTFDGETNKLKSAQVISNE